VKDGAMIYALMVRNWVEEQRHTLATVMQRNEGQTLVEYGIIIAIALIVMAALAYLGNVLYKKFMQTANAIQSGAP
jgi:Flp pilus assembly pilin Flp